MKHTTPGRLPKKKIAQKKIVQILLILGAVVQVYQACSPFVAENLSSELGRSDDGQPDTPGTPGVPLASLSCKSDATVSPTDTRRLTKIEFYRVIEDLFDTDIAASLGPTLSRLPEDVIESDVSQFSNQLMRQHLEALTDLSFLAGQYQTETDVLANKFLSLYGPCLLTTLDTVCIKNVVKNFGLRAWRRPLTAAESTWVENAYATGVSERDKLSVLISALLAAPEFQYHWEFGSPGGSDDAFDITDYELASRISFSVWNSIPDAALFGLAASGALKNAATRESTLSQMLSNPRAAAKVRDFFVYWLNTANIPGIPNNPNFLGTNDVSGLRAEMKRELDEYVDYITFGIKGSYRDLMTNRTSFARSPALAQVYGHALSANPGAAGQTMGGNRRGLLLRAPFLISSTDFTHPITRGVRIRKRILCDGLGAPAPEAFAAQAEISDPNFVLLFNNRERITQKTSQPQCIACHSSINPIGFALEGYDSLGRLRQSEVNYDVNNKLISQHSLNLSVSDLAIDYVAGESASSADELVDLISNSSKGPLCFSRQVFRYYKIRLETQAGDACEVLDSNVPVSSKTGSILDGIKRQINNRYIGKKVVKR